MGEYQYYEFIAIDRPLTAEEMEGLRALSTRALITPVSFTNEYHWGDFKGNPDKLMERCFDAHVYMAIWRTAVFKVRVPGERLPKETVAALASSEMLNFKATKTHWIITWVLEESEYDERFVQDCGRGWMARLSPIRDELLNGDFRSLYLGWLADVSKGNLDDEEMEPLSVNGLGQLTSAQQALAEFLEVDRDLLAGAGLGSHTTPKAEISPQEMDMWIDALPREEVNSILKQLLEGKGRQAEPSIRNLFASWRRGLQPGDIDAPRRTVRELRQNAEKARLIRMEKQERGRKHREIKRRKQRETYLKNLSSDFPKAWASVREPVERGSGRGYDEACRRLVDIAKAHDLFATKKQFQNELKKFMAGHLRRKALIQRLVKAGIWRDQ